MKIEHLIFDMDNTLYPCSGGMDKGISARMMQAVADFFNESVEEAIERRKANIRNFSTTLEWLTSEGLTDIEAYFAKVHPENEADELSADEKLRPFLESIKIPKIILTNAPSEHAERVLEKLNVRDQFDFICDIRYSKLKGKPYASAFEGALKACGGNLQNTLFLDDMLKYTDGWVALGGTAILVGNKNGHHLDPEKNVVYKSSENANSSLNKTRPLWEGRTLRIESVYGLPQMLEKLAAEE